MPNWTKDQSDAIYKKGTNIIVSAGAGSGKTAVLSERVLNHLKNKVSIDNLLILTFTNAAAAEMKERIRNKIIQNTSLENQLDKIDSADITTFDAYTLKLVKKYSHLLNISKEVTIIEDSIIKLKKKEILNLIFEEYYQSNNKLFDKLINDFCLKDDKEIFETILNLNSKLDNVYKKRQYLENYISNNYNEEKINFYIDEYQKFLKENIQTIEKQLKNLSYYVEGTYITKLEEILKPLFNSTDYEEIKRNIPKLPNLPKNSQEEAKNIKKEISNVLKNLNQLVTYENIEAIKSSLINTKDYVQIIIEIILKLDKMINEYKNEENVYEFIDISQKAIQILEENEEVRQELKEKYYEILIDEYQDTNDLQEKFISYIENENVYMVGDIKQSIYRFRNTNPLLFKNKYDLYSQEQQGIKIDLTKNFRSRNEVLDGINQIFNQIMDNTIGGADYSKTHQMVFGNQAYNNVNKEKYNLEILNYEKQEDSIYSNEEIEIFTIAKDIKNKIENKYQVMDNKTSSSRSVNYNDFVILLDRSSSFDKYKKIFEYLNIPLTIYKDKAITNSIDIYLIKNIINLIINIYKNTFDENFKYSFVSISRSYLINSSDKEIFHSIKNESYKETQLYQKCENLSKNILEMTTKELIIKIIDEFNFYQKIIKDRNINEHITIIDSIVKIANSCDKLGYSPFEFNDYLKEILEEKIDIKLSLNKGQTNSVKIMTIHASKGLEYPICYYSGLYKKFNIADLKEKFYFSSKYGIISPYYKEGPKNTILKTLLKNDYIKEEISEKLRLFYVALTRAREKMIIVTSLNENILSYNDNGIIGDDIRLKYMSFKEILDSVYKVLEKYIVNIDIEKLNLTKDYNLSKLVDLKINSNQLPLKVEEKQYESKIMKTESFSKKTDELYNKNQIKNIEFGLKLHDILENIDFKNPDYSNLNEFETNKVKALINNNIFKNAQKIYKEYEFIYEENNEEYHGIIDLLIIKKNENIIIDYKLKNIEDKAYLKQLNGYKNYIEKITNKNTNIYLYSILNEKLQKIN